MQCHIGSQITDLEPLAEAARELAALSRRLLDEGFPLETIDIGGGLGVDYEGGAAPDPQALADARAAGARGPAAHAAARARPVAGRAARASLLTRVLYLKENRGKTFVIVDAGMNDLLRPALYQAFHRIEPVAADAARPRAGRRGGPGVRDGRLPGARPRAWRCPSRATCCAVRDAGAYGFAHGLELQPAPARRRGAGRGRRACASSAAARPSRTWCGTEVSALADHAAEVARAGQAVEGLEERRGDRRGSPLRRRRRAAGTRS